MMIKRTLAVVLMGFSFSVLAEEAVLVRQGNTELTRFEAQQALERLVPAPQRGEILSSEKRMRDFVAQLFATKRLAAEVDLASLTPEERWRVDSVQQRELAQIQLDRAVARVPDAVLEQAAQEAYLANPKAHATPEQVHAQHILVGFEGRTREEADARMKELRARLDAGEPFDVLAREYSDDKGSRENGGDLGFFPRGKMVGPFEEAAFALQKEGELSGTVETQFGLHVLRFAGRKASVPIPFEQVKQSLIQNERLKLRRRLTAQEYERIGKLPGIEADQQAISSLVAGGAPKAAAPQSATPAQ